MTRLAAASSRSIAAIGVALGMTLFPCAAVGAGKASLGLEPPTNSEEGATALDEVVVTAQRRSTDLQNTPIAISVFGARDLERRHVETLVDLVDGAIPSLRVTPFFSRTSSLMIGIRGVGSGGDAQAARDMAVGVYLDGVYLGRTQGLGAAFYDVEQIEVLRGPQGTLFGRNTQAGAISMVTRKPTGKPSLEATGGIGNYNSRKIEVHANLPATLDGSIKIDALLSSGAAPRHSARRTYGGSYRFRSR